MNQILLFEEDFKDGLVSLSDQRFVHIRDQLKAHVGDSIKIGQFKGRQGTGIIVKMGASQVLLKPSLDQLPPSPSQVNLVLAMPRPKVFRRVLRSVIELGVKEIHLIHSWRVEKSYWQSPLLSPESLHTSIIQGLSIAKDTVPPAIHLHQRFKPFVEDILPSLVQSQACFIAHPSEQACPANVDKPCWLAIGPEGGFIDYEIGLLQQQGFDCVSLGARILRVETAVSSAIGRLNTA